MPVITDTFPPATPEVAAGDVVMSPARMEYCPVLYVLLPAKIRTGAPAVEMFPAEIAPCTGIPPINEPMTVLSAMSTVGGTLRIVERLGFTVSKVTAPPPPLPPVVLEPVLRESMAIE